MRKLFGPKYEDPDKQKPDNKNEEQSLQDKVKAGIRGTFFGKDSKPIGVKSSHQPNYGGVSNTPSSSGPQNGKK